MATELDAWRQKYQQNTYWYGSDGGYSVMAPGTTDRLFIMNDTWYAPMSPDGYRHRWFGAAGSFFTTSSVGVQPGDGNINFDSYVNTSNPQATFPVPPGANARYWPSMAFARNNKIYIGGAAYLGIGGFPSLGDTIVYRIESSFNNPAAWVFSGAGKNVTELTATPFQPPLTQTFAWPQMPFNGSGVRTGAFNTCLIAGASGTYVFLYGFKDGLSWNGGTATFPLLARTEAANFDAGNHTWLYWDGANFTSNVNNAAPLFTDEPTGPNYCVEYSSTINKYILTYCPDAKDGTVKMRFADQPRGPWTPAPGKVVFKPKMMTRGPDFLPGAWTYCLVRHSSVTSTPFLYSIATNHFYGDWNHPNMYFPVFFQVVHTEVYP